MKTCLVLCLLFVALAWSKPAEDSKNDNTATAGKPGDGSNTGVGNLGGAGGSPGANGGKPTGIDSSADPSKTTATGTDTGAAGGQSGSDAGKTPDNKQKRDAEKTEGAEKKNDTTTSPKKEEDASAPAKTTGTSDDGSKSAGDTEVTKENTKRDNGDQGTSTKAPEVAVADTSVVNKKTDGKGDESGTTSTAAPKTR